MHRCTTDKNTFKYFNNYLKVLKSTATAQLRVIIVLTNGTNHDCRRRRMFTEYIPVARKLCESRVSIIYSSFMFSYQEYHFFENVFIILDFQVHIEFCSITGSTVNTNRRGQHCTQAHTYNKSVLALFDVLATVLC
jgi:hypothetical protein